MDPDSQAPTHSPAWQQVGEIAQTIDGQLWVPDIDGLYLHDAETGQRSPAGLGMQLIHVIYVDPRGDVWIGASECNQLARELHDSATQSLYAVTLYADAATRLLSSDRRNWCVPFTRCSEANPRSTPVSNILSKLHLASRTQATLFALWEGLTSLDDASISLADGHRYPQNAL